MATTSAPVSTDLASSSTSSAPIVVSRRALQEQIFLREMDLTPVTMVNCLRSTHSDVMHLATTVLAFQQPDPPKGFGAKLNSGTTARVLNPKAKKQRVKPIATRKKHLALLREHADFMARLNAERTERLEIESWAASQLQVAVRRFLRRTDRRFGGPNAATAPAFNPKKDRFLRNLAAPQGVDVRREIRALVGKSNQLVENEDDDLDMMPPWQREEAVRARAAERARHIRRLRAHVATRMQSIARGFIGRRAVRFAKALDMEERQTRAAVFIQSHARVFTSKQNEFKLQKRKIAQSVKIQAFFRGYMDRQVVRVIHARLNRHSKLVASATLIQAHIRQLLARRRLEVVQQAHAAIKIQANVRAVSARRRVDADKQDRAATTIQARIRSKQAASAAIHVREDRAARKVQASARGMLTRKDLQQKREEEAATKIQAVHRGRAQRTTAQKKAQTEAAIAIQAARRGNAARQLAAKQEEAARSVQKVVRGSIDRRAITEQEQAALKIQAIQRGRAARSQDALAAKRAEKEALKAPEPKQVEEKDTETKDQDATVDEGVPTVTEEGEKDAEAAAAAKLQALARGRAAREELEAKQRAAIELQKVARGRKDRNAVEEKRRQRKAALEAEAEAQDSQSRKAKRRDIP
eukprot:INCI16486.1.p1 GENE.INCI16486.1~~INCI16486.1.p1  ORF type:complete len:640 (-),score=149.71 INCI16486.1:1344-3263(-)